MIKIYLFFTYIIYPFLFLFLRMRVLFNKECPIRFKEKLGKINSNKCENVIWFHVASLGEIKSIHSIIKHYQKNKNLNILITSVTQSSYEYFKENLQSYNTHHQYAPLDNPVIISKFLKNWKPKLSIFIESEIWPNMIMQTSKVSKIILLNCRISKKSFKKWRMFKTTFKNIMTKFDYILPQNDETLNFLKYFDLDKIKYIGNLKFINIEKNNQNIIKINDSKNSWVAMSIHYEEINDIIETHLKVNEKIKNLTTYIIPRHLNKIDKIIKKIENKKIQYQQISSNNFIKKFNGIVIIDKFGLAEDIFDQIKIVFMGGSFIEHGGQNPIEPLKYGCKVLSGENIFNFAEIYNELANKKLAEIVNRKNLFNKLTNFLEKENLNLNTNMKFEDYSVTIFNKTIKFLNSYILNEKNF